MFTSSQGFGDPSQGFAGNLDIGYERYPNIAAARIVGPPGAAGGAQKTPGQNPDGGLGPELAGRLDPVFDLKPEKKTARWQRIAREAARQSGRSHLPVVSPTIQTVEEFCRESRTAEIKLVFWEEEEVCKLSDVSTTNPPRSVAFLSGPEGGFSLEEIATARRYGFQTITLGPRILRAETAPIVILSLLQNRWGDL